MTPEARSAASARAASLSDAGNDTPVPLEVRPGKGPGRGKGPIKGKGGPAVRVAPPQRPKRRPALKDADAPLRLNKFIANAGVCVRREADLLITAGAVTVNGTSRDRARHQSPPDR